MAAKKNSKYGEKASDKVERAMHERKEGTLRSGSGQKVTSRKQAIAIGLSEAREGGKVPAKKRSAKKSAAKKSAASPKKRTAKKSTAKKRSPKKRAAR